MTCLPGFLGRELGPSLIIAFALFSAASALVVTFRHPGRWRERWKNGLAWGAPALVSGPFAWYAAFATRFEDHPLWFYLAYWFLAVGAPWALAVTLFSRWARARYPDSWERLRSSGGWDLEGPRWYRWGFVLWSFVGLIPGIVSAMLLFEIPPCAGGS